jgi:hypothetical protein
MLRDAIELNKDPEIYITSQPLPYSVFTGPSAVMVSQLFLGEAKPFEF